MAEGLNEHGILLSLFMNKCLEECSYMPEEGDYMPEEHGYMWRSKVLSAMSKGSIHTSLGPK